MKTNTRINRTAYTLPMLFAEENGSLMHLKPDAGIGVVQIIRLEKGLQARIWDCTFHKGFELHCTTHAENETPHFVIACFLQMQGLQFVQAKEQPETNEAWNAIFLPPATTLKINITPNSRLLCLSISFSIRWFDHHVLNSEPATKDFWKHIFGSGAVALFDCMNASEENQVQEFVDPQLQKAWSTLHTKSGVLQLISDFTSKLKEKETLLHHNQQKGLLTEAESLLCQHITGPMPDMKHLAVKYGLSEITLKRHFKQKHGVSMLTFFISRKMAYAKQLIVEKGIPAPDVAHALGYKNVHHFMVMYQKHTDDDSSQRSVVENIMDN